ncbi:hypothetical protein BD626DRAFT_259018 [Schizophyllum amplum]|uniref:Uncharacterized protein n=1 Tax=Schizophyllum amplum TaxID=97359 RepID=A0A550BUM1_9AGAR|nr:hypothetical protein BD626DRAFT_259018 [Auriculariopsis ampla]
MDASSSIHDGAFLSSDCRPPFRESSHGTIYSHQSVDVRPLRPELSSLCFFSVRCEVPWYSTFQRVINASSPLRRQIYTLLRAPEGGDAWGHPFIQCGRLGGLAMRSAYAPPPPALRKGLNEDRRARMSSLSERIAEAGACSDVTHVDSAV